MKNNFLRLGALGVLVWLVPFIIAFGFFDSSGKPAINDDLFKSIMIVISSVVGGYAIIRYFKSIQGNFMREAWRAGVVWLVINLALDLVILVPLAKMSYTEYFNSIGVVYLQIPVICVATGMLLDTKLARGN